MDDSHLSDLEPLKKGQRVKVLREMLSMTQKDFADRIDVQQSYLSRIENGDKGVGKRLQKVIIDEFRLSSNWFDSPTVQGVLTKERESSANDLGWLDGDYETHITKNGNEHVIISDNNYLLSVKLVSQKAYAGYLAGYSQPEYLKDLPSLQTSVKNFHNGTYRGFEVKGDSMDCDKKYAIEEGDIAIGRQLHPDMWKYKLHIHEYKEWLIVHDGGIIIKHISAHDVENGVIHCVSYNDDKMIYPDFDLNLKDVYELYNVIKIEKFR